MIKLACFFCFCLFCQPAICQDTLPKKIKLHLNEEFWMQKNFQVFSRVSMPWRLREERSGRTALPTRFDSLTDNPINHGATYVAVKSTVSYQDKVWLDVDLYAEQRGSSYGLFNKDNLLLYPVFGLRLRDSVRMANHYLTLTGKAGMFLNEKKDEGLTLYNVDAQGLQINVGRNKWQLQGTVYADLFGGIGLNIDDVYSVAFKRKIDHMDSTEAGVSLDYYKEQNVFTPLHSNLLFMAFAHKGFAHGRVYAQLGLRPGTDRELEVSNSFTQNLAGVAGCEYHYNLHNISFTGVAEARYYGAIFNEWWINYGLRYRKPAANIYELYGNTVGNYLYPLRKLNTPFSQWAVFTEYTFSRVIGLTVRGDVKWDLGRTLFAGLSYDLNYIRAADNLNITERLPVSSFLYPFFTASASYAIVKGVAASLLLTNQTMNLDLHYSTYYLLAHPRVGLRLTACL